MNKIPKCIETYGNRFRWRRRVPADALARRRGWPSIASRKPINVGKVIATTEAQREVAS